MSANDLTMAAHGVFPIERIDDSRDGGQPWSNPYGNGIDVVTSAGLVISADGSKMRTGTHWYTSMSTLGETGALAGAAGASVELVYLGAGLFHAVAALGHPEAFQFF